MNVGLQTSKNRYRTPLPFGISYQDGSAQPRKLKEFSPTREVRQAKPPASLQPQYNAAATQPRPSLETTRSSGSSGGQAAVDTDAWLPYQRAKGISEIERMRAELDLLEQQLTSSTERSSPSTGRATTESSRSSDPPNESPDKEHSRPFHSRTDTSESQTWPLQEESPPPAVPRKSSRRMVRESLSPPREATRRIRLESESPPPPENLQPVRTNERSAPRIQQQIPRPPPQEVLQPVRTNDRNATRIQQPAQKPLPPQDRRPARTDDHDRDRNAPGLHQPVPNYSRPWSPDLGLPKRPTTSHARARDIADTLSSLTARPAPRARSRPSKPAPVQFEKVEGVTMDTQPASAKSDPKKLSMPEIEARDIRKIPTRTPEQFDEDMEYFTGRRHCARSPPPVGSSHDYVPRISPKPVVDGEEHTFIDNYSRAADDKTENPNPDDVPARYRRSIVAPFSKVDQMTPQPEEDEEEEEQEAQDIYDEDAAEAPSVARTRAFEAQDQEMNSRTHAAKNLIGGMLKGLTGHKKDKDKNEEKNQSRGPALVRDFAALATDEGMYDHNQQSQQSQQHTSHLHDDSDSAGANHYDYSIWSPNDVGRRSVAGSVDTVIRRGATPTELATFRK
ncbi:hypothetical protein LTR70_010369 [Exophiala xenobiotica]|uniref:Uncharacterized protein n=1 Tax=Lithohypha guttulata TaxID=1690604 RepID=A0ABR0JU98_9EURO|nr:hypothetical protein LTR24_010330 [Lithohypha guttulata]KAK5309354.1 hypothetical protein LTR70_010369 [Exophiala xenobiotica]